MELPPGDVVGLYKYVIGGLVTAVTVLATAVGFQYRSADKVNRHRLSERDTLNEALSGSNQVLNSIKTAIEHRNVMMEELSKLITQQGTAFTLFVETMKMQQEMTDRERTAANHAITVMSQSIQEMNRRIDLINGRLDELIREMNK